MKRTHLYVVTGASRGLGAAIAAQLLDDPASHVLGLARGHDDTLAALLHSRQP